MRNQKRTLSAKKSLAELEIVNLLTLQDNYLVCLLNEGVLDLSIPNICCCCSCFSCCSDDEGSKKQYMSHIMEFYLRQTLMSFVFSSMLHETLGYFINLDSGLIRTELAQKDTSSKRIAELAKELKFRFRLYGILGLVIFPFALVWLILYHLFKNAAEVCSVTNCNAYSCRLNVTHLSLQFVIGPV